MSNKICGDLNNMTADGNSVSISPISYRNALLLTDEPSRSMALNQSAPGETIYDKSWLAASFRMRQLRRVKRSDHGPRIAAAVSNVVFRTALIGLQLVCAAALLAGQAQAANTTPSGTPALEVIAPNGIRSILMGSLHVASPSLHQPDPRVLEQFQQVVVEHRVASEVRDIAAQLESAQPAWIKELRPIHIAKLREHLKCRFPDLDSESVTLGLVVVLAQATPGMANELAYATCDSTGYHSRDDIVLSTAEKLGLPLRYLETEQEIARSRAQLATGDIRQSFDFAFSPEATRLKDRVIGALNRGDYPEVAAATELSVELAGGNKQLTHGIMVRDRNSLWMKSLPDLLEAQRSFVLVGASHLPGSDGLVALLRARGFTINAIELPTGSGR
ncbi:TraB/GumN family protein (plasmid) [Burkholderia sp. FERM BP-3421]|uniref:TraB/GumN family protein n=1 Tax=Burkholderia sp. FERM BP-3421 TaxID=1494466 RepID=UPI0023628F96|nr:TraB/GumN family protein [Burkholderia sp. FERM BP-3421]WDD90242.1 TraB/GumN family protein [Burkholderia sp. FERM BP-3421]